MDKIEGEQQNCHFTLKEGDAGDAAFLLTSSKIKIVLKDFGLNRHTSPP
jgi:hypothetical protein